MHPIKHLVTHLMDSGPVEGERAGPDKLERLGFCKALLDPTTFAIHTLGPDCHLGPDAGFVKGFERGGFFYTRSAAARAAADWI